MEKLKGHDWGKHGPPSSTMPGNSLACFPSIPTSHPLRSLDLRQAGEKMVHWKEKTGRKAHRERGKLPGKVAISSLLLYSCDLVRHTAQSSPACVDFLRAFLMSSSVLLLSLISSCCVFISRSLCRSVRAFRAWGPKTGQRSCL